MIKNNEQASRAFQMALKFHTRIQVLEYALRLLDDNTYVPVATLSITENTWEKLHMEVSKDQVRGQLIREISDLKADLKVQAYEMGGYFGV